MKKIMKLFVFVAAAAMTLASCQKNEISGPVTKEVHFTINAGIAETKTTITEEENKKYTPKWESGDKIGVLFALEANAKAVDFENTAGAGAVATFEGKHAFTVEEGATEVDGNLYAFYPSSAFEKEKKIYSNGEIRLDLKATQNPTSTSFDPSCDLLIAKPCYYMAEATGESVEVLVDDMYFARMMSVLRINLNSEFLSNETVKSVSFDADGVDFTGAMRFNLETGEFVGNQSTSQDLSEVKADYSEEDPIAVAGEKNSAYLVVAPVTIPSGTALTFTIETENYDIVKTINAPADMEMPAGNIAVINLTIAEENCTAKTEDTSDYSGEWLITGVKDEQVYAASAYVSGNNLKSVAISIENGQILEVDGIANCMMTLTKVADGDYAGMYTITDVNGKYLYAASSSGNQLKGATEVSVNAYWTVELQENGTYSIVASKSSNRNVMQFNGSDADHILFNCYSSASQSPVTLYPYSMVKADTTPRITVEETEYKVSADDETLEISYNTRNINGTPTVSVADATMKIVEAKAEADADAEAGGTVTVTFDANAEEVEKTATLVLSYEGTESVSVTITQAAKAAEGGESGWISTPFANLKEGDQVVIVSTKNTDTWAMSNDKGTSAAPTGVTGVTYANGKLTAEPAENIIWHVGVDGNNRIFYKDSGKDTWLYCTGTNNGVRVGTNTAKTFTFESNYLKHVGTNRYVGVYTTTPDWRCYTSINTNIQGQTFQFFVKTGESGGEEGGETPDDPVQLTMSEITCSEQTENSLTFNWTAVANATGYEVTFNNKTETVNDVTYTATGLTASTQYTISVKAVGDGTNYTTSEAKTQTGTTAAAQGGGEDGGETTGGYTLVTSLSDITTGQYVIAAKVNGTYYAMSNTYSSKISGTTVTVTDNIISESDANNYVVTITKTGDKYTIQLSGKYLSYGTSGTNFSSSSTQYSWNISEGTLGTFRISATTGSNRGLIYRASTYNQFGGYSTTNVTANGKEYFDVELFKLAN